jgi:glycosyltransferase involved in cell wall biosynthesis
MKVDILFCARNRREYTEEALRQLERNTNWDLVTALVFWDDGSMDGAGEIQKPDGIPSNKFIGVNSSSNPCGSPVSVMNAFIALTRNPAPWFAKIDNDTIVPPGWLDACVSIAETGNVDLIGIEARYCKHPPMTPGDYPVVQYRTTDHIGGIGLFRRAVFDRYPLTLSYSSDAAKFYAQTGQDPQYFGFTEWQMSHPDVRKVWIDPPLPVFLLDHLPFDPWRSLGYQYVQKGWQRNSWGEYGIVKDKGLWEWWLSSRTPS